MLRVALRAFDSICFPKFSASFMISGTKKFRIHYAQNHFQSIWKPLFSKKICLAASFMISETKKFRIHDAQSRSQSFWKQLFSKIFCLAASFII